MQPIQGWRLDRYLTQGSSLLATLGWIMQSFQDWVTRRSPPPKPSATSGYFLATLRVDRSGMSKLQRGAGKPPNRQARKPALPHNENCCAVKDLNSLDFV